MDIKVNNISFKHIEFKNPNAKKVFREKLKSCTKESKKEVRDFIKKQKAIKNKAIIDVTKEAHNGDEVIMFATFSHDKDALVVDNKGAGSVIDFLNRCAAKTGYDGEMLTKKTKPVVNKKLRPKQLVVGEVF